MLFIMLCSASQHQANHAYHFVPYMLIINIILQIITWQFIRKFALYDSFITTTHISVLRINKLRSTTTLELEKYHACTRSITWLPYSLTLLCQHYCWHNKTTYIMPKAMPVYCACPYFPCFSCKTQCETLKSRSSLGTWGHYMYVFCTYGTWWICPVMAVSSLSMSCFLSVFGSWCLLSLSQLFLASLVSS